MSFVDGLAFERQARDAKTRKKVDNVIYALRSRRVAQSDIDDAIKYLKKYRDGGHLT